MIDEIFVIDQGGTPLFYKCYDRKKIDPILVSSLFSALTTFAKSSENELDEVTMSGKKYIFLLNKFFLLTIRVGDTVSKNTIIEKLTKLQESFIDNFKDIICEIGKFDGEVSQFDGFEDNVLKLFDEVKTKKNIKKSSEFLEDLLGLKQKIDYKNVLDNL